LREDNLSAAEVELRHAIQLDPEAGAAHRDLGAVLRRKGQPEEALAELRRATQLLPENSRSHFMLAQVLQKLGKPEEAEKELQLARQLIQKEKEGPLGKAYNNEGSKLLEEGRLSEATEKFRQSLGLNPHDEEAQYNLALSLLFQNQIDESIQGFHTYLRSVPDDPEALYYLGLALLAKGRASEAITSLQRAVARWRASVRARTLTPY
jgi:tetratricopeptide (TPR) repeat protein